jgi:hypothetical protein
MKKIIPTLLLLTVLALSTKASQDSIPSLLTWNAIPSTTTLWVYGTFDSTVATQLPIWMHYTIMQVPQPGDSNIIQDIYIPANGYSFDTIIPGLMPDSSYILYLIGFNNHGHVGVTVPIQMLDSFPAGISNISPLMNQSIWVVDKTIFSNDTGQGEVYDLSGRKIASGDFPIETLAPTGIYIVCSKLKDGVCVYKRVFIH